MSQPTKEISSNDGQNNEQSTPTTEDFLTRIAEASQVKEPEPDPNPDLQTDADNDTDDLNLDDILPSSKDKPAADPKKSSNPVDEIGKGEPQAQEDEAFDLQKSLQEIFKAEETKPKQQKRMQQLANLLKEQEKVYGEKTSQFDQEKLHLQQQLAEIQAKLEENEAKNKQLSDLESFITSDDYSTQVIVPKQEALAVMNEIFTRSGLEVSAAEVMALKGADQKDKLNEVWGEIGAFDQSQLKEALIKYQSANDQASKVSSDPSATIEAFKAKQQEAQNASEAKAQKLIQDHIQNNVLKNNILTPMETEGIDNEAEVNIRNQFNQSLETFGTDVQNYASISDPQERANVATKAAMFDRMESGIMRVMAMRLAAQNTQIDDLRSQVETLGAKRPKVGGGGGGQEEQGFKPFSLEAVYEASQKG